MTTISVQQDTFKLAHKIKDHMEGYLRDGTSLDTIIWISLQEEWRRLQKNKALELNKGIKGESSPVKNQDKVYSSLGGENGM